MSSFIDEIKARISPLIAGTHFHLIEIKRSVTKRFLIIRVFMDRDDGYFSHQDCVEWSRKIQDLIDAQNLIRRDYRLEVSSPGIGKLLIEPWEFKKNLEKILKVQFTNEENSIEEFVGTLIGVDDFNIELKNRNNLKKISWNKILKAKVQTPW
jgi:ribosome maturation factor RimP